MERRSPTGIDSRQAVETPQRCRSRSAGKPLRVAARAAISFPAVLTHRSGGDP